MIISLVAETREDERRVLLLPQDAGRLVAHGVVLVERGAGAGLGIGDVEYEREGAVLVDRHVAWSTADLVLKLKAPKPDELARLQENSSVMALFHAEATPETVDVLLQRGIHAYSFEFFQDSNGSFPLMAATGEIAGQQAVLHAAFHLQRHLGGSGRQFASCLHWGGCRVAILGYGNVGRAAAKLARGMGADVLVFRWSSETSADDFPCFPWRQSIADEVLPGCDVIIGAVRISTFDTPPFVTRTMVQKMRAGSVIVDVTAGYGTGFIETSEVVTTLTQPFVVVDRVKHIKIRELPKAFPETSARQISAIYSPHIERHVAAAKLGLGYDVAERGLITARGVIISEHVARHFAQRFSEK